MMEYEAVAMWVRAEKSNNALEAVSMELATLQAVMAQLTTSKANAEEAHKEAAVMQKATDVAMRQMMLADVFAAFDVDGDGFVDAGELMQLGAARQKLKQEGRKWTEAKNKQLVELLDTNRDGAVSRDEFV